MTTTQYPDITSKLNERNGGRGSGQGYCGGIGGHQERGRRGGCSNHPLYTPSIQKFKEEVEIFGAVLGTSA